jgi:hypothetical protein
MRFVRRLPFAIALALSGCLLTSGQFVIPFEIQPDPLTVPGPATVIAIPIDLNNESVYNDHKQDIAAVTDAALLGDIENLGTNPIDVEVWMTPETVPPGTVKTDAQVRSDPTAVLVWGPLSVAPSATRHIGWDESAALFTGRQAILAEVKGDGAFTLYALGPAGAGTYHFSVHKPQLVVTIDAGV